MMQVASFYPPERCIDEKLSDDFNKLEFQEGKEIRKSERSWSKLEDTVEFDEDEVREEEEDEDEDEDVEEEFSFVCVNTEVSPITADEAFEDGQIRPVFPLFNRDLLFDNDNEEGVSVADDSIETMLPSVRKFFVEDPDGNGDEEADAEDLEKEPMGPYCSWSGGTVAEASPERCRKSNSTGFSKLWRFRDLVLRSNSDGRDAYVYLNSNVGEKTQPLSRWSSEDDKKKAREKKTTKKGKDNTTSQNRIESAHERLYMRNRALKEEGKHRSYLPYKQVGFFTNVNGLSRNIHPF